VSFSFELSITLTSLEEEEVKFLKAIQLYIPREEPSARLVCAEMKF
jgi:hypothetical protein